MSFVNTPACRPYCESLTAASASSNVWYGLIVTTGPEDLLAADLHLGRHVGRAASAGRSGPRRCRR